jgi:hypothetical protein
MVNRHLIFHRPLRLLLALIAMTITSFGLAQQPVALVLDVTGDTDPPIDPYTEVASGTELVLGDTTRLEFLHYNSCEDVTVQGGRLSFSESRFQHSKGDILELKRQECPTTVAMTKDAPIGGILLRGNNTGVMLVLGERPGFVIVGQGKNRYEAVTILREGNKVFEGKLDGARFRLPPEIDPLEAGNTYQLVLSGPKTEPTEIEFLAKTYPKTNIMLLRVD